MYKSFFIDTLPKLCYPLFRLLLVLSFVCLAIIGTGTTQTILENQTDNTALAATYRSVGLKGSIFAASGPGGNVSDPVVRAVDIAEPAVVRIFTTLGGQLTVHFSTTNVVTFPQANSTSGNAYPLGFSGTGAFISPHGDVLTADHVINPPHDTTLDQYLNQTAAPDVAAYINQSKGGTNQVTAGQVQQALNNGQWPLEHRYGGSTSEVVLNTSYTGPLNAPDLSSLPAQIHASVDHIEKESSVNDKDVAIVHVNINDIASLQLGDSSNVHQQDQLTIIGFPGNGDVSMQPTDLLTASVNTITVSSIKTTDTGAQVIQVGGNVEHGDSGGPALDNNGTVVGIVSFGLSNSGGTTFLQASNSAEQLVQSLNLDTKPGPFQQAWSQAFTDYAATTAGHWHKAAQEFASIAAKYPLFKAVQPYLTYTQQQAKTEPIPNTPKTPTNKPSSQNPVLAYVWTIGAVVVLLALIALLYAVVVRRRGKKSPGVPGEQALAGVVTYPPDRVPPATAQPNNNAGNITAQQRQTPLPAYDDGMTAFGAPPSSPPAQPASTQTSTTVSSILRPWPCGHLNRPKARFCSICGEPASQTTRQFDQ